MSDLMVRRITFGDSDFGLAKAWEYEVFGRENDYTEPADDAAGEMVHYRRWERSSEFYVGFAADRADPVAVLRALRWHPGLGHDSFSTLADLRATDTGLYPEWERRFDRIAPEAVAELATQAVRRSHRRLGAIDQLWAHFADRLTAEGVRYVTVALVVPLFEWYRLVFGPAITQIGALLPDYVGADSIPAVLDLHHLVSLLPTMEVTQ